MLVAVYSGGGRIHVWPFFYMSTTLCTVAHLQGRTTGRSPRSAHTPTRHSHIHAQTLPRARWERRSLRSA